MLETLSLAGKEALGQHPGTQTQLWEELPGPHQVWLCSLEGVLVHNLHATCKEVWEAALAAAAWLCRDFLIDSWVPGSASYIHTSIQLHMQRPHLVMGLSLRTLFYLLASAYSPSFSLSLYPTQGDYLAATCTAIYPSSIYRMTFHKWDTGSLSMGWAVFMSVGSVQSQGLCA